MKENEKSEKTDKDEGCKNNIEIIYIIGEIEGHDNIGGGTKATKYEELIPRLARMETDEQTAGILIILHTMGGDVEAGLAISEMISSLSKPTVSLVLGGSHSIGVPIAVSADYSFIVESGTMVIHPVRMSGTVIGASQTYSYFRQMQDRITDFVCEHSGIHKTRFMELMTETEQLTKDIGSILVGDQTVQEGLINEIGGMKEAYAKLLTMISDEKKKHMLKKKNTR